MRRVLRLPPLTGELRSSPERHSFSTSRSDITSSSAICAGVSHGIISLANRKVPIIRLNRLRGVVKPGPPNPNPLPSPNLGTVNPTGQKPRAGIEPAIADTTHDLHRLDAAVPVRVQPSGWAIRAGKLSPSVRVFSLERPPRAAARYRSFAGRPPHRPHRLGSHDCHVRGASDRFRSAHPATQTPGRCSQQ